MTRAFKKNTKEIKKTTQGLLNEAEKNICLFREVIGKDYREIPINQRPTVVYYAEEITKGNLKELSKLDRLNELKIERV